MLADGKPLTRLWFVPRSREEFSQAAVNYARLFFRIRVAKAVARQEIEGDNNKDAGKVQ